MVFTVDNRAFENSIAFRVERAIKAFKANRARRAIYRQTYDELMALSPRDLEDLGITQYEIPGLAKEAAEKF